MSRIDHQKSQWAFSSGRGKQDYRPTTLNEKNAHAEVYNVVGVQVTIYVL